MSEVVDGEGALIRQYSLETNQCSLCPVKHAADGLLFCFVLLDKV